MELVAGAASGTNLHMCLNAGAWMKCCGHRHSLTLIVVDWMVEWRWGLMLVVVVGVALSVEEGSSLFAAVADTVLHLASLGMVGLSVNAFAAAETEAGSLDASAQSGLTRKTTLR